ASDHLFKLGISGNYHTEPGVGLVNGLVLPETTDRQRTLIAESTPNRAEGLDGLLAELDRLRDPEHRSVHAPLDEESQYGFGCDTSLSGACGKLDHAFERAAIRLSKGQHVPQLLTDALLKSVQR